MCAKNALSSREDRSKEEVTEILDLFKRHMAALLRRFNLAEIILFTL